MRALTVNEGHRFGRYTILRELAPLKRSNGWSVRLFECRCDCGTIKGVRLHALTNGSSKSCGCWLSDRITALNVIHGNACRDKRTREYRCWSSMKTRCADPTSYYYGMLNQPEWNDFAPFLRDMGPCPSRHHSIDRRDTLRGYSAQNCRWATPTEQARNKTNNHTVLFRGKTVCLAELAESVGMSQTALGQRINDLGMLPIYATSVPIDDPRLRDKRWLRFFSGKEAVEPAGPRPAPQRATCRRGHALPAGAIRRNGRLYCPQCAVKSNLKYRTKKRQSIKPAKATP
jgi:hypothetical protein